MARETWQEMGLKEFEYEKIIEILGRTPNFLELSLFAVMWSEHCSYKTSRPVLKFFPTKGKRVLQGPGENAGVVDIGDGQAAVFKIESHNHPSAVEPFQGAATGVGGIVRDVFAMGARPIALLNSIRFGELDSERVRYLFEGAVDGMSSYGNCLGIPNVGGEVYFENVYEKNPLVNAMCVGLIDIKDIKKGFAKGIGNPVMAVGARTGRDGIHGATFASEELDDESKVPTIQAGDPFMEKLLLEACLEMIKKDCIEGMQDMGAAGLISSSCEMAFRAETGVEIDLDKVPVREKNIEPYEIMLSESQERMLVVPKRGKEKEIQAIFEKWGLEAAVIGKVTDDGNVTLKKDGEVIASVPAAGLTEGCPVFLKEREKPKYLEATSNKATQKFTSQDISKDFLKLLSHPTIADKEWIYNQFDYSIGTNTVIKPGHDGAVIRIKGTKKGLSFTTDGNGRYCYLNPYVGGQIAVAEAARNLVTVGAEPIAVTDCLNFASPENPEIFWQFYEAVQGISSACQVLNTPVVGGNVSFYNETEGIAIYPTPIIGMVGLLEDIENRVDSSFKDVGDKIFLLGNLSSKLDGSHYLYAIHGEVVGDAPELDLEVEKAVQKTCLDAIRERLVKSAHDVSDGGLAVAIAESSIKGNLGAKITIDIPEANTVESLLFGEAQSRIVVSVAPENAKKLVEMASENNINIFEIGEVIEDKVDVVVGQQQIFDLHLKELEKSWRGGIPCFMK